MSVLARLLYMFNFFCRFVCVDAVIILCLISSVVLSVLARLLFITYLPNMLGKSTIHIRTCTFHLITLVVLLEFSIVQKVYALKRLNLLAYIWYLSRCICVCPFKTSKYIYGYFGWTDDNTVRKLIHNIHIHSDLSSTS